MSTTGLEQPDHPVCPQESRTPEHSEHFRAGCSNGHSLLYFHCSPGPLSLPFTPQITPIAVASPGGNPEENWGCTASSKPVTAGHSRSLAWPADWCHRLVRSRSDMLLFIPLLHPNLHSWGFSRTLACIPCPRGMWRGQRLKAQCVWHRAFLCSWGNASGQRSTKIKKPKHQPAEDKLICKQTLLTQGGGEREGRPGWIFQDAWVQPKLSLQQKVPQRQGSSAWVLELDKLGVNLCSSISQAYDHSQFTVIPQVRHISWVLKRELRTLILLCCCDD